MYLDFWLIIRHNKKHENIFLSRTHTNLLVSHVMTLPSKPDVTRRRVLVSYSMFFTQLAWPCSEQTFEFSLRRSHNAMVVSSEQVANKRLSKNLREGQIRVKLLCRHDWRRQLDTLGAFYRPLCTEFKASCWRGDSTLKWRTLCCWRSPRGLLWAFWCVWTRWDRTTGPQSARRPQSVQTWGGRTHKSETLVKTYERSRVNVAVTEGREEFNAQE